MQLNTASHLNQKRQNAHAVHARQEGVRRRQILARMEDSKTWQKVNLQRHKPRGCLSNNEIEKEVITLWDTL